MIRGVIFDLDGVILDSMAIWNDLSVRFLKKRGIRAEKGLSDLMFSMSLEQGAAYLKEHYPLKMTEKGIIEGIREMIRDFYFHEVKLKKGAKELVEYFDRKGIKMIAATSSPSSHVTRALSRNGLSGFLRGILTTSEENTSKHEPLIYEKAAKLMGTSPPETLVFEDALYALKTAADAGFVTVGVYDAHGEPDQEGMKTCSEIYVRELSEFLEYADAL